MQPLSLRGGPSAYKQRLQADLTKIQAACGRPPQSASLCVPTGGQGETSWLPSRSANRVKLQGNGNEDKSADVKTLLEMLLTSVCELVVSTLSGTEDDKFKVPVDVINFQSQSYVGPVLLLCDRITELRKAANKCKKVTPRTVRTPTPATNNSMTSTKFNSMCNLGSTSTGAGTSNTNAKATGANASLGRRKTVSLEILKTATPPLLSSNNSVLARSVVTPPLGAVTEEEKSHHVSAGATASSSSCEATTAKECKAQAHALKTAASSPCLTTSRKYDARGVQTEIWRTEKSAQTEEVTILTPRTTKEVGTMCEIEEKSSPVVQEADMNQKSKEFDQNGKQGSEMRKTRTIGTQAPGLARTTGSTRLYEIIGIKRNAMSLRKGSEPILRPTSVDATKKMDSTGSASVSTTFSRPRTHEEKQTSHQYSIYPAPIQTDASVPSQSHEQHVQRQQQQRFCLSKNTSCASMGRIRRGSSRQNANLLLAGALSRHAAINSNPESGSNARSSNKENSDSTRIRTARGKGEKIKLQCALGHGLQWVVNDRTSTNKCSYCYGVPMCDNIHTCALCLQDEGVQVVVCEKCSKNCFEPQPLSAYIPVKPDESTLQRQVTAESWLAVTEAISGHGT